MILSVIIPVYNEVKTIKTIVYKILNIKDLKTQIIIVDDCSIDGTKQIIKKELMKKLTKLFFIKKFRKRKCYNKCKKIH